MKIFLSALFIMATSMGVVAQPGKMGNWLIYIGSQQIKKDWNIHHEVQYRNYNIVGDLEQLLVRTGVGYNLTENNNNVLLGYAYIHSKNYIGSTDEKNAINEHRIFQQFITRQKFGRVSLQHRYRLEERFIVSDFKMRFRYFLAINVVLNKKEMMDGAVYLSAYDELFINARQTLFDRNRLYGGLGYRINKNVKIELGYMNQFLNNAHRDQLNLFCFLNF